MAFQLKFALYLPHLKSFELIHFRRRLSCIDCRFYREPEQYHNLSERTQTDRNGPKRTFVATEKVSLDTETDFLGTETDRNGLSLMSLHGRILA